MAIKVTPEAAEALDRSLGLMGLDPATAGIRLSEARGLGGGSNVQISFADSPAPTEKLIELEGLRFFVDPAILETYPEAVITLEPQHETVLFRPA